MSWPKVNNALNSTTNQLGANDWANLISDYYNGIDIGLIDPSKKPIIGTLTTFKFEKLVLQDTDGSHTAVISLDDIDTGSNRTIRFRRQVNPYESDWVLMESNPATIRNKSLINPQITFDQQVVITGGTSPRTVMTFLSNGNIDFNDTILGSIVLDNDSGTGNGLSIWDSNYSHKYLIGSNNITANRTISLPLMITNGDFVVTNAEQTLENKSLTAPIMSTFFDMVRITIPSDPTINNGRFYNKQIDSNNDGYFVKIKKNGSFQEIQIA